VARRNVGMPQLGREHKGPGARLIGRGEGAGGRAGGPAEGRVDAAFSVSGQGVGGDRCFTRRSGTVYHRRSGTSSLRWPS